MSANAENRKKKKQSDADTEQHRTQDAGAKAWCVGHTEQGDQRLWEPDQQRAQDEIDGSVNRKKSRPADPARQIHPPLQRPCYDLVKRPQIGFCRITFPGESARGLPGPPGP